MKIWAAPPGLETVYSKIDCMSGQPSVKAAEVVAGTSKDENFGQHLQAWKRFIVI